MSGYHEPTVEEGGLPTSGPSSDTRRQEGRLEITGIALTDEQGDGYTVARHMLDEIATAEPRGLAASELGHLVADVNGQTAGAWLRELHARGWVRSERISPGSTRVRWHVTDAGREELKPLEAAQHLDAEDPAPGGEATAADYGFGA